ncbi:hypothetical protein HYU20_00755 [Candidatus Woesearchaeota archaeon]|nr:hypothetical protein [Candidatus Woesearchaeota archaeon]
MREQDLLGGVANPAESEIAIKVAHYYRHGLTILNEANKRHEAFIEFHKRETQRIFRAGIRLGAITSTIAAASLSYAGINLEKLPLFLREETQSLEGLVTGGLLLLGGLAAAASMHTIRAAYSQRKEAAEEQEQIKKDYNASVAEFEETMRLLGQHYPLVYAAPCQS